MKFPAAKGNGAWSARRRLDQAVDGHTKAEVDEIVRWLTGYSQKRLESQLKAETDFEPFFAEAPTMNPNRSLITGAGCGIRVEEIDEPTMREIRYLDLLVDERANRWSDRLYS